VAVSRALVERLREPGLVVCMGVALTLLVLLEGWLSPWAPFFPIYAALAIALPLWLRSYQFGRARDVFVRGFKKTIMFIALALIVDIGLSFIYAIYLSASGLLGNPYYDLNAALNELASAASTRLGITVEQAFYIYAIFVLVWAPIGEEIFYRGYLYGELKGRAGRTGAAIISTIFFGLRHATHFALLPVFPLGAALWWAFSTAVFGLVMAWAYEETGSLHVVMLAHFITNVVGITIAQA